MVVLVHNAQTSTSLASYRGSAAYSDVVAHLLMCRHVCHVDLVASSPLAAEHWCVQLNAAASVVVPLVTYLVSGAYERRKRRTNAPFVTPECSTRKCDTDWRSGYAAMLRELNGVSAARAAVIQAHCPTMSALMEEVETMAALPDDAPLTPSLSKIATQRIVRDTNDSVPDDSVSDVEVPPVGRGVNLRGAGVHFVRQLCRILSTLSSRNTTPATQS